MKSLNFLFSICLLLVPFLTFGQFQDDFNDGNFTNNPTWEGDVDDFLVNNDNELQLSAAAAGTSILFINTQIPDSTIWEMFFNANLAPSGSNGLRVYLQSDDMSFTSGNGYFFEFGESGSDDAINFYRMDNGSETLLGTGTIGAVGASPADGRMRVTRTATGEWEVQVDYNGGNNLITDLTFIDNTYAGSTGNYFGIQCRYTSSNTDNFSFDDFNLAPLLADTSPPSVTDIEILSGFDINVFFDESVDETSAENISNYTVGNGVGNPQSAIWNESGNNPSMVRLIFASEFTSGQANTLTVNGVQDLEGNAISNQEIPFTFFFVESPQQFEIVINEIMADPSPTVGLPDVEFVELFNNSNKTFELSGSSIESGGTPQVFDSFILEPGEYLILTDDSNLDSLLPFGNVLAVSAFPALSNSGDDFVLRNEDGLIIDAVSYNTDWYEDNNKVDGGWTLELINPNSPCEFASNWRASEDISGGTPGRANSILNQGQSSIQATLESLFLNDFEQLILNYNVSVNELLSTNPTSYVVTPNLDIQSIDATGDLGNQIRITFSTPLETGVTYTVSTTNITDCIGNAASTNSLNFGKPELAQAGDILINEILFNPATGGSDYLELYNNSDKIIDLSSLSLGNFMPGDTSANGITTSYLLLPQTYAVLTEDRAAVLDGYIVEVPEALRSSNLPSFDNDIGNITLFRSDPTGSIIIDQFDYEDDFHSAFLDDEDGVSLERISFTQPTQSADNWHSAAASVGFGTPTAVNSQFENLGTTEDLLTFPNSTFSPDADGFEDLFFIQYNTETAGFSADIRIYDSEGNLVKRLARNELLPVQGTLRWDGLMEDETKARIGIYILLAEFVSPEGEIKTAKETFVLAARL